MGKILESFWKNFFENSTTVYKAGFSKLKDWKNLVTKIITKYPVVATFKILKIIKKSSIFLKKIGDFFIILRILKVATTGYFVMIFVTRFFQSLSVLKPALYTVVEYCIHNIFSFGKIEDKMQLTHRTVRFLPCLPLFY